MNLNKLNGMIYARYKSQAQMADALGWSRNKLNTIVNGKREPDLDEVAAIAANLGESLETVANIFLSRSHQTGN